MKRIISTALVLLLFINAVYTQSTNTNTSEESDLVPFRSKEMRNISIKPIDTKSLFGYWISLDGNTMFKIFESNNEILIEGDYFPDVLKNGDKATLSVTKTSQGYSLNLFYMLSRNSGGGGNSISIVYYPLDNHLVVGKPPYHEIKNGELWTIGETSSSNGIYGKEFKRMNPKNTNAKNNLTTEINSNTTFSNNQVVSPPFVQKTAGSSGVSDPSFVKVEQVPKITSGTNFILQVSLIDIIRSFSGYSNDHTFNAAINLAVQKEKTSQEEVVLLFGKAFEQIDPNAKLSSIFMSGELRNYINSNSTNSDVLNMLIKERDKIIISTMQVLRKRLERFGISQINIKQRPSPGRYFVEVSDIKSDSLNYEKFHRVLNLLRNSGKLEFWETYGKSEIYPFLLGANKNLSLMKKPQNVTYGTDKDIANESPLFRILKNTEPNDSYDPIIGYAHWKDSATLNYSLKLLEIKSLFPRDLLFGWSLKPTDVEGKTYTLNALKISSPDGNALLDRRTVKDINSNKTNILEITFNTEDADKWRKLTHDNVGKKIAVVFDNKVLSHINVQNEIKAGICSIECNLINEDFEDIVNIINSGQLPAIVELIGSQNIGN